MGKIVGTFLLFFTLFHASTAFFIPTTDSNSTSDTKPEIVGGRPVAIENFPYQIGLEYFFGTLICGGSILNPTTIVTAAHCVQGSSASSLNIRAGTTFKERGGQVRSIRQIFVHPNYNAHNQDYDVAILKLSQALSYGSGVQPLELSPQEPNADEGCVVSGWGSTVSGGSTSDQLNAVSVPAVSRYHCKEAYGQDKISDRMICAGYKRGGKDSCQGDSGGPLVSGGRLVGIVSWGYGCASPGYPGVYTNVADDEINGFIQRYA